MKFWNIRVYGFDDVIALSPTVRAARWAAFKAGREAGYFSGGFADFLANVGTISPITLEEARQRIGGHPPIGAPRGWEWPTA